MLKRLTAWWADKQSSWMHQRIAAGPHLLGKRSVFILPTRQGFYLAFFLLAMLLACINYNLSLGYMLTFFVFAVGMGAMHRTHQNLLGTRIEALPAAPVFAGEPVALPIKLDNPSRLIKHAITVAPRGEPSRAVHASLPSQGSDTPGLTLAPLPRGIHRLPALEISSSYPLGLWRAWSYAFSLGTVTVYPEAKSPLPQLLALPQHSAQAAMPVNNIRDNQGDAVSHLESVTVATARAIHWPALAKGQLAQRLLDNDTPLSQGVMLALAGCTVTGTEAQLSQLCFAIQHCAANGVPFVLHVQGMRYPASGQASLEAAHIEQCLHALAAYD
jgi:hypothetical protein